MKVPSRVSPSNDNQLNVNLHVTMLNMIFDLILTVNIKSKFVLTVVTFKDLFQDPNYQIFWLFTKEH